MAMARPLDLGFARESNLRMYVGSSELQDIVHVLRSTTNILARFDGVPLCRLFTMSCCSYSPTRTVV